MARVTIEDCLEYVPNRFELVMVAVERARKLEMGAVQALVEWEKDKPSVVALREIAEGKVGPGLILGTSAIKDEQAKDKDAGDMGEVS